MTDRPPAAPFTLAFLTEGDAESADRSFSGTAHSILGGLRAVGVRVHARDAELYGWRKLLVAARVWAPERKRWQTRFRLGGPAFAARSARARAAARALPDRADAYLQVGATFAPAGAPYFLYCDWNARLAERFATSGQSPVNHLRADEQAAIDARETAVYRGASAIFTISERLRASFVADYGIPPERVVVAYPGPNMDAEAIPVRVARRADVPPTILFVGKEFVRKGGDVLLAAFARVRERLPDARCVVVGPADIGVVPPGVELLGPLRKDDPAEFARLLAAYGEADVFCLPTRYEPLGIVTIEAMYAGLPCVTSDTWAMGEMVADGETGYTVPVDDDVALADRLHALLADPTRAAAMGAAGRSRALERFSWRASAETMRRTIAACLGTRTGARASAEPSADGRR